MLTTAVVISVCVFFFSLRGRGFSLFLLLHKCADYLIQTEVDKVKRGWGAKMKKTPVDFIRFQPLMCCTQSKAGLHSLLLKADMSAVFLIIN